MNLLPNNTKYQGYTGRTTFTPFGYSQAKKRCGGFGGISPGAILFDAEGNVYKEYAQVLVVERGYGVFDGVKGVVYAYGDTSSDGSRLYGSFAGRICVPAINFRRFPECRYRGWTRFSFR